MISKIYRTPALEVWSPHPCRKGCVWSTPTLCTALLVHVEIAACMFLESSRNTLYQDDQWCSCHLLVIIISDQRTAHAVAAGPCLKVPEHVIVQPIVTRTQCQNNTCSCLCLGWCWSLLASTTEETEVIIVKEMTEKNCTLQSVVVLCMHACWSLIYMFFFKHFFLFITNSTVTCPVHANFSTSQHSTLT